MFNAFESLSLNEEEEGIQWDSINIDQLFPPRHQRRSSDADHEDQSGSQRSLTEIKIAEIQKIVLQISVGVFLIGGILFTDSVLRQLFHSQQNVSLMTVFSCFPDIQKWFTYILLSTSLMLLVFLLRFQYLKQYHKDDKLFMIISYGLQFLTFCCLLYGIFVFITSKNYCQDYSLFYLILNIIQLLTIAYGFLILKEIGLFVLSVLFPLPLFLSLIYFSGDDNNKQANLKFKSIRFNDQMAQYSTMCPICLIDFDNKDDIISLPCDLRHSYHQKCINLWVKNRNICPLCKNEITQESINTSNKRLCALGF